MMREEEIETAIKVVIVGNGAVGKSSMIQRYCKGMFVRDYKKTIGVDFLERLIEVNGEDVRLMLWDTAGQEEFDAITKAYYRGAQACVLAFSTTDMDSFYAISNWKRKVEDEVGEITMVLVQNKIDLLDMASIDETEITDLASELGLPLFRTSVKDDIRVDDVFTFLATRYLNQMDQIEDEPIKAPHIGDPEMLNSNPTPNGKHQEKKKKKKKRHWLKRSTSSENTVVHLEPSKRRTTNKSMVPKCRI